jgi:NhaA family Na+:H+ antiporter
MAATIAALVWANLSSTYADFWHIHLSVGVGTWEIEESLVHWVNDLLMAVFFYVVALEVKREMTFGALRDLRAALVPTAAAFGTMIGAAATYVAVNASGGDLRGWAIPIATDIAFALGVLGLVGSRAPRSLRSFMLTLAVVDDLATIVVIAVFFTADLSFVWMAVAAGLLLVVVIMQRAGVESLVVYVALAGAVWVSVLESGVHATIAGVLLGLLTPAFAVQGPGRTARKTATRSEMATPSTREATKTEVLHAAGAAGAVRGPLMRMEEALHPYTSFVILPVFAFANAGVPVSLSDLGDALGSSIGLGIFLGLVVGAPLGGLLLAWLSVRIGPGRLQDGLDWPAIAGVAPLKGIGFTIAIFITALTFEETTLEDVATLAILMASLVAAMVGLTVLLTRHTLLERPAESDASSSSGAP